MCVSQEKLLWGLVYCSLIFQKHIFLLQFVLMTRVVIAEQDFCTTNESFFRNQFYISHAHQWSGLAGEVGGQTGVTHGSV